MFEIILLILIGLFIMGLAGLVVVYGYWSQKKNSEQSSQFADKYGLTVDYPKSKLFGYPVIYGKRRGYDFRIYIIQNKSFDMHDLFTVIDCTVQVSGAFAFAIFERTFISKLYPAFRGFEEIVTGDALFDQRFVIKTNNPSALIALMDESLRQKLMAMADRHTFINITFDGTALQTKRQGTMVSEQVRTAASDMLDLLAEMAVRLNPDIKAD